jgi:hypothetical protein
MDGEERSSVAWAMLEVTILSQQVVLRADHRALQFFCPSSRLIGSHWFNNLDLLVFEIFRDAASIDL